MENPTVLERRTLCFSSYKLKVKLSWLGARERKRAFSVPFILPKSAYTFRIYILLHIKKHYFIHFCYLFLKSSKVSSVSSLNAEGKGYNKTQLEASLYLSKDIATTPENIKMEPLTIVVKLAILDVCEVSWLRLCRMFYKISWERSRLYLCEV